MILFGIYEKLVYPKSTLNGFNTKEVITQNLHRATLYNNLKPFHNLSDIPEFGHTDAVDDNVFRLVCYYNFPSDSYSLQVKDIDPFLCTHINVAFASVHNNSINLNEVHLGYLQEVVKLKDTNKNLKILLSIGGSGNSDDFPEMVKNHTNRKTFIQSILYYVKTYGIDGIDLDWEFPSEYPDGDKNQRMHFTQLLAEIRKNISRQKNFPYLLTAAVAAPAALVDAYYDVSYMNDYVDFVNVMNYDFHFFTTTTPFTGINSPLYPLSSEKMFMSTLNINYSSHYWNYKGMEKNKIVVGLPTYGHTYRLLNPRNHEIYSPASGYGKLGFNGFASYYQICNFLQVNHITPVFDMEVLSPYASKYYEWISFDDEQSLTYKTEFIKNNQFGGAMIYCLNSDDFKGSCTMGFSGGLKFPLISTVKSVLGRTDPGAV
uniref:Chitinase-3-like protein 2 n=2 Tax=Rhynchophorus ferrugineus TaxID=354439 RepID=A0A650DLD6_RHYFE|nr:chitinase-3-like protein 2 [Rhynchophorus ferrugineus]